MRRSKPAVLRSAILLVILCFAVYGNVLNGAFVWDDQMQVVRNANIRTLDNIPRAFVSSLWSFVHAPGEVDRGQGIDHYYRPIQTVIYILTYQVGGLSPRAYHLTNVALHATATVALFLLCIQLGLSSLVSFLAATLFAVHPVHTEAVSWIAGVGDVACAVFYFSGLYTFLRYRDSRKVTLLYVSSACFFAALLSKEMAVTFPVVALLLILVPQGKHRPDFK